MDVNYISKRLDDFFKKNHLIYTYNDDVKVFSASFSLTGRLQNVNLIISLGEEDYLVNAILPLRVDKDSIADMSLLLSAINFRLRNGAFTLDLSDGSLQYKIYEKCYCNDFSDQQIMDSIMLPVAMVDQHSEFILAVIFKTKSISDILNDFNSNIDGNSSTAL